MMIRKSPLEYKGPKAYFTDFDHRLVSRHDSLEELLLNGERKLKALLLIKGNIVIAASHLASEFSYNFFKKHQELLCSGAIIPAFRSDKNDISELFKEKTFKEKGSAISFYLEKINETVSWDLDPNSTWFRDRFLADLDNNNSLIRRNINHKHAAILNELANRIRNNKKLSRLTIDEAAGKLPHKERITLLNYRELLYHISGARVVQCESALPQENYIDFDIADMTQHRTKLSDQQILFKLFMELVFDSFQKHPLSVELIDQLSFHDVLEIRQPILESTFQEKYDELISLAVNSNRGDSDHLFNIEQLEGIRTTLVDSFKSIIDEQMPRFITRKALEESKKLLSTSSSVALGIAGLVPVVGTVASLASIIKETPALLVNLSNMHSTASSIKNMAKYQELKNKAIHKMIKNSQFSDKTNFLDLANVLCETIAQRSTL